MVGMGAFQWRKDFKSENLKDERNEWTRQRLSDSKDVGLGVSIMWWGWRKKRWCLLN